MSSLEQLAKQNILEQLPGHFVNGNVGDLIRKLEEIEDNWRIYTWGTNDFTGNLTWFTERKEIRYTELKEIIIKILMDDIYYDYDDMDDDMNVLKESGLLTKELVVTGLDTRTLENFLTDNLIIDKTADYNLEILGMNLIISCHNGFINKRLAKIIKDEIVN